MQFPMRPLTSSGALGALFALLMACAPGEAASTTRDSGAADDPAPSLAADVEGTNAPEAASGAAPGATAEQRLQPGMARLDTGIDLAKLNAANRAEDGTSETHDEAAPAAATPALVADAGQAAATAQDETGELPPGHVTIQGEEKHDFGELIQGTHAAHVFRLVSDGDNDLVISRIKPSCGCTVANVTLIGADGSRTPYITGDGIAPGTEFEIEAAFKSDGKNGRTKTQVAVYCNDPRTVISLMLEADVQPVLTLEPRTLNLGQATSAEKVEGTMRLSSATLPAFKVEVDPQFVQKHMTVDLTPVSPDAEGRAREWDVHVTLGPELPEGMRNYPIRLLTDQPIPSPREDDHAGHDHADGAHDAVGEQKAKMYFAIAYAQVQVRGLVSANPAYVPFGMVRPGQVVERVVRIECHDDFELTPDIKVGMTALIQSDLFDYQEAFSTKLDAVEGENALDLTVRLEGLPDGVSGSFGGMLKLIVEHPNKKEVMVRFSGVCRPGVPEKNAGSGQ